MLGGHGTISLGGHLTAEYHPAGPDTRVGDKPMGRMTGEPLGATLPRSAVLPMPALPADPADPALPADPADPALPADPADAMIPNPSQISYIRRRRGIDQVSTGGQSNVCRYLATERCTSTRKHFIDRHRQACSSGPGCGFVNANKKGLNNGAQNPSGNRHTFACAWSALPKIVRGPGQRNTSGRGVLPHWHFLTRIGGRARGV